jgi:hypothetical protein
VLAHELVFDYYPGLHLTSPRTQHPTHSACPSQGNECPTQCKCVNQLVRATHLYPADRRTNFSEPKRFSPLFSFPLLTRAVFQVQVQQDKDEVEVRWSHK